MFRLTLRTIRFKNDVRLFFGRPQMIGIRFFEKHTKEEIKEVYDLIRAVLTFKYGKKKG